MLHFCYILQGHDTTAAAMNWAVHLLGSHPEIQRKAQQELDEIFGASTCVSYYAVNYTVIMLCCAVKEAKTAWNSF